jgi:hypothetical protein
LATMASTVASEELQEQTTEAFHWRRSSFKLAYGYYYYYY